MDLAIGFMQNLWPNVAFSFNENYDTREGVHIMFACHHVSGLIFSLSTNLGDVIWESTTCSHGDH